MLNISGFGHVSLDPGEFSQNASLLCLFKTIFQVGESCFIWQYEILRETTIGVFFIFMFFILSPLVGGRFPIWLISFFRWVETTNQTRIPFCLANDVGDVARSVCESWSLGSQEMTRGFTKSGGATPWIPPKVLVNRGISTTFPPQLVRGAAGFFLNHQQLRITFKAIWLVKVFCGKVMRFSRPYKGAGSVSTTARLGGKPSVFY